MVDSCDVSVLEVDYVPSPREVVEIDLTDSPTGPVVRRSVVQKKAALPPPSATTRNRATNTSPESRDIMDVMSCPVCLDPLSEIR
jgi:hypothetical protein